MPTEKEIAIIQKATIYDLCRLLKKSGKESFTVAEVKQILDTYADQLEE